MSKIKDDPQKMWKRRIIDMELKYHARSIQKRLYLGSPKSFKDWKMLIYEVKSSSMSFCRAWDRVIIGRDDSDRLVRNLRLRLLSMGRRLSFTIMAARLDVVTPRVQTINNGPMVTCTGHFTTGGSIKFRDNRWV
ncbi:hypothetical protein TNCV_731031 [Trichonephila clavipes]|nr:hypothetical protein TNCV_731031 [Trichonephila clavipes]